MIEHCSNCRNWKALESEETRGFCRAHPPLVIWESHKPDAWTAGYPNTPPSQRMFWPVTESGEWCGEWQRGLG